MIIFLLHMSIFTISGSSMKKDGEPSLLDISQRMALVRELLSPQTINEGNPLQVGTQLIRS